ncbi:MAG: alkaline phosphatase family protein [Planctomycetes bacterium]|nr:alkaline phosphatase family protein [Planctomycetota bacterium]
MSESNASRGLQSASRRAGKVRGSFASKSVAQILQSIGIVALLLWVAGCSSPGRRTVALTPEVERPTAAAVVFLVDGLDHARFEESLRDGLLPNIRARFVDGGVGVDYAITSLPPITYPNLVSLLTGCFPGHHGIVGNQWFDRRSLVFKDYDSAATYRAVNGDFRQSTMYELMADRFTVSVQCPARRGVTHTIDNWFNTGRNWLFHQYSHTDRRVGTGAPKVVALANRVGRWPSIWMNYFPGLDAIAHESGPESAAYRDGLQMVDRAIGQIMKAVEDAGMADQTYFFLVTDHSHITVDQFHAFDVARWLEDSSGASRGLQSASRRAGKVRGSLPRIDRLESRSHRGAAKREPDALDGSRPARAQAATRVYSRRTGGSDYAERLATLNRYDVVMTNGVYRRIALHLRGERGWPYSPTPEEVARFADRLPTLDSFPALELMARRAGDGRVRVDSRHGSALVQREGDGPSARYRVVVEDGDPLHFDDSDELDRFASEGWHDAEEWLAATADARYPDFVVQIVALFDSPRSGDILLFAADDWTFGARYRGGHGSCVARDMRVPMFIAGPNIPRGGRIRHARLVDIMPTLLDLLSESHRLDDTQPIDGVSRADEIRAADPVNHQITRSPNHQMPGP